MQIIAKVTLAFTHPDGSTPKDKARFVLNAGPGPQIVPDWVTEDELYQLAKKDGSILEIGGTALPGAGAAPTKAQLSLVPDDDLYDELDRRERTRSNKELADNDDSIDPADKGRTDFGSGKDGAPTAADKSAKDQTDQDSEAAIADARKGMADGAAAAAAAAANGSAPKLKGPQGATGTK
jgi:hypothetical protein